MTNIEMTLLKQGETIGSRNYGCSNQLEALSKYGVLAANTDLAIALGSNMPRFDSYVMEDRTLRGRTGNYVTQSMVYSDSVQVILSSGESMATDVGNRGLGIRPVMKCEELIPLAKVYAKKGVHGIDILEYGEYPQYSLNQELEAILEELYLNGSLQVTGKTYTFDSRKYNESILPFEPVEYAEYVYGGRKYVRIYANPYDDYGCKLSNGKVYQTGEAIWLEVSPVQWIIDELSGSFISLRCLLSGIRFNTPGKGYDGDIKDTEMYRYINTIMLNDLLTIVPKKKKNTIEQVRKLEKIVNS